MIMTLALQMDKIYKNILLLIFQTIIILGCNSNCIIYLPDGRVLKEPSIESFNKQYPLKFNPYEGLFYTQKFDQTNLKIILYTNNTNNIYNNRNSSFEDVYNKLKNKKVVMLRFNSFIPYKEEFWDSFVSLRYKKLKIFKKKGFNSETEYWHNDKLFIKAKYNPQNGFLIDLRVLLQ